MKVYRVGGAVRDDFMGRDSKDEDFSVEVESFDAMRDELVAQGFSIFVEKPQFLTISAKFPKGTIERVVGVTGDFVMCRKDGAYSDGRRPDEVFPGTVFDDLARRDFTMNAIAVEVETQKVIDPYDGRGDIERRIIRAVGDPMERIREDALRALRAVRFATTLGFEIDGELADTLSTDRVASALRKIATDRKRMELDKMFKADTIRAMDVIGRFPALRAAAFDGGIRLFATQKEK